MTAPSSLFSVNGSTVVQAHAANYGATVTFVIQSLTGVASIVWTIVGTSKSTQAALVITPSGTPSGATATVTMPADPGDGLGRAFGIKLTVANSVGESSSTYRVFGKANAASIIPVVNGEELWRDATYGYTDVFNQVLNTVFGGAGGSNTQLQYNNGGALDGASGITVVGSETGLKLTYLEAISGTIPPDGLVRGANNAAVAVSANAAGAAVLLGYVDDTDVLWLGRATGAFVAPANARYNVATSGSHKWDVAGTTEFEVTASTLDCNQNSITDLASLALGSGNISGTGHLRFPQVATGQFRNNANDANLNFFRLGSTADDIWIGDTPSGCDLTFFAATTMTFAPGGSGEYSMTATAFDMNGNNLSEVGAFDHDGSTLGFYGTTPTTKQAPTGSRGGNAALASLLTALATIGLITDSTSA